MNRWFPRCILALALASFPAGSALAQGGSESPPETSPEADENGEEKPAEKPATTPDDKKKGDGTGKKKEGEKKTEGGEKPTAGADANADAGADADADGGDADGTTAVDGDVDGETGEQTLPAEKPPEEKKPPATKPAEKKTPPPTEEPPPFEPPPTEESPIADLANSQDDGFVALEDIDEESVDPIFPAEMYPHVDWNGMFRFRQVAAINYHLGTTGTSAILPPAETYTPTGNPVDPDARTLWSADMLARFEPTFSITEGIRLHIEADLLGNQMLGSLPVNGLALNPLHPDPSRNHAGSGQFSTREREWFSNALSIGEAYGELTGFFGSLRIGRMDNHWGLGMFYNGGDCADCNFGDSIDRVQLRSSFKGINGSFSMDYPGEGLTSRQAETPTGQPYDLAQVDDISQYTVTVSYEPATKPEEERQRKRLTVDRKPVLNGGALFSWRSQEGTYADPFGLDPNSENALIYRGMRMYIGNAWGRFMYQPNSKTSMKIELEAMGIFGDLDNQTYDPVGQANEEDEDSSDINCFNEDVRNANSDRCTGNKRDFRQFGLALQSEFAVGGPITFGLDGGFASGGDAPNWGYGADDYMNGRDLDFFRFDPDYHVDLILFRRVIGTVTNAYYLKPHMEATFLDRNEYKLRLDVDTIVSRAFDMGGTPAGDNSWLGVEVDTAFRFFLKDSFHAGIHGGLLFPLQGMGARVDRPRLTIPGSEAPAFSENQDPSTAWTVQFNANWMF